MTKRPPSQRIQQQIEPRWLQGSDEPASIRSTVLRLGTPRVVQELREHEVTAFLGRDHYRRGPRRITGYRNGYKPKTFPTVAARIPVQVPQVRETPEPFPSRLVRVLAASAQQDVLPRRVTELDACGLSTRDIADTVTDATGTRVLTQSPVSHLTETRWTDCEAFPARDLSGFVVEYVFLDAVFEPMRRTGQAREGVLAAWGIGRGGQRVLLHLALGNTESADNGVELLRDLVRRGPRAPTSIPSDGAPGRLRAIDQVWFQSLHRRCGAPQARNVWDKVPATARAEVTAHRGEIREAATPKAGRQAVAAFPTRFERDDPRATKSLLDALDASLNHLRVAPAHRKDGRTTHWLERAFEEDRRRTRVIPRFWTAHRALKLVFGTLDRANRRWLRRRFSDVEVKHRDP